MGTKWGFGFATTRRVVWLCILVQLVVDLLGHAYSVFRLGLPVTLENIQKCGARDFHAESWCLSIIICIVFGVRLIIRMFDATRNPSESLPTRLDAAIRQFSYTVAVFASLSAHMWWDGLLSFSV